MSVVHINFEDAKLISQTRRTEFHGDVILGELATIDWGKAAIIGIICEYRRIAIGV